MRRDVIKRATDTYYIYTCKCLASYLCTIVYHTAAHVTANGDLHTGRVFAIAEAERSLSRRNSSYSGIHFFGLGLKTKQSRHRDDIIFHDIPDRTFIDIIMHLIQSVMVTITQLTNTFRRGNTHAYVISTDCSTFRIHAPVNTDDHRVISLVGL